MPCCRRVSVEIHFELFNSTPGSLVGGGGAWLKLELGSEYTYLNKSTVVTKYSPFENFNDCGGFRLEMNRRVIFEHAPKFSKSLNFA